MRILIVGGGPGGLYAAILLKKANPDHDITITERNPAGATYGWGVVFSDRTLNSFREADFPSYQRIVDDFVHWTAIDIHYRGEVIRADGHDFAGMSRRSLLNILQDRCRELGVDLRFEQEIRLPHPLPPAVGEGGRGDEGAALDKLGQDRAFSPSGLPVTELDPRDYDVVIAADGINSRVRSDFAPAFQPSISLGAAKFVWFGTDKVLDAFTFLFKVNEHGLFQVHAYPFDGQTSTFIVECEEDVWRRAGLDQADEGESIAYCENLFADYLRGARLLSNRSLWGSFVRVKSKRWRFGNVVLLGDAAHTAHFSIGSGTKLAMDGAIALARGFEAGGDLDAALRLYEMEHRPRVDALQAAADESRLYFEHIRRYLHLEPPQFAFHLLTRSGRIHYDNLRTRDPAYVDSVDRWFHAPGEPRRRVTPPPMFSAFTLRGLTLSNRIAATGDPVQAAQTGASLILTPPVAVSADGRITPTDPLLTEPAHADHWRGIVESVRQSGEARIAAVLNHAGRRGSVQQPNRGLDRPLREGAWPLCAPSALPYTSRSQTPQAMTRADMTCVCEAFTHAAELADAAGFDLLHLHMGHGYLLASFLSPLTNQRADEYGGSFENRLRFPLEVLDAVRAAWPSDRPLGVALNVDDAAKDGLTPDDAILITRTLKDHGCDLLEVLVGQTVPHDNTSYAPGFLTPYADRLRHEAGIPVLVGGYLTTSGEINTILAGGRADLCIMV